MIGESEEKMWVGSTRGGLRNPHVLMVETRLEMNITARNGGSNTRDY